MTKQNASIIAANYGKALYSFARKNNKTKEIFEESVFLINEFLNNKKAKNFLAAPHIQKKEKHNFINTVFEGRLSLISKNMLHLIVENKKAVWLKEIFKEYIYLVNKASGFQKGNVYTAVSISENEKNRIIKAFENYTGKKLKIKFFIDQSLLGGIVFKSGGFLFDQSIRGNLKRLKSDFDLKFKEV
jgi:F-type H+-transporting ATPase subunit delta